MRLTSYYNTLDEEKLNSVSSNPWNIESGEIFRASSFGYNLRLKKQRLANMLEMLNDRTSFSLLRTFIYSQSSFSGKRGIFSSMAASLTNVYDNVAGGIKNLFGKKLDNTNEVYNKESGMFKNEFNRVSIYLSDKMDAVKNKALGAWNSALSGSNELISNCEHKLNSFLMNRFENAVVHGRPPVLTKGKPLSQVFAGGGDHVRRKYHDHDINNPGFSMMPA
mgnify:CR=1 FL=1